MTRIIRLRMFNVDCGVRRIIFVGEVFTSPTHLYILVNAFTRIMAQMKALSKKVRFAQRIACM